MYFFLTLDSQGKYGGHRRASVGLPNPIPLQFSDALESEDRIFSIIKLFTGL